MNVFTGLDVSLASIAICAVSENGKILRAVSTESEPESLVRALQEIDDTIVGVGVGLEAGPLSQWLYKHLTDAGFENSSSGNASCQRRLEGNANQKRPS